MPAGSVHHPEDGALGDDLLVIVRVVGFGKIFHKILTFRISDLISHISEKQYLRLEI
jgi:hypothetical protein